MWLEHTFPSSDEVDVQTKNSPAFKKTEVGGGVLLQVLVRLESLVLQIDHGFI